MSFSFVMIGAGNLACHLTKRLVECGLQLRQVFSRTEESAKALSDIYNVSWTTIPYNIAGDADIYFICLRDSVVPSFLDSANLNNKFLVHCSGGLTLDALTAHTSEAGVLYPLQTFSKNRQVNFTEIPLFLESSSKTAGDTLFYIARKISSRIVPANSHQRAILHIAAVFSCNFVNHFYAISDMLLKENNLDFTLLYPLMKETLDKALSILPFDAQTGPAVRNDRLIVEKHLERLNAFPDLQNIYMLLSDHIYKFHQK